MSQKISFFIWKKHCLEKNVIIMIVWDCYYHWDIFDYIQIFIWWNCHILQLCLICDKIIQSILAKIFWEDQIFLEHAACDHKFLFLSYLSPDDTFFSFQIINQVSCWQLFCWKYQMLCLSIYLSLSGCIVIFLKR